MYHLHVVAVEYYSGCQQASTTLKLISELKKFNEDTSLCSVTVAGSIDNICSGIY